MAARTPAVRPDPRRLDDLFASFGKITLRRMFGGEGIFSGEVMLGLVFDERIFLKVSDATRPAFLAEGASPFTYTLKRDGTHTSRHYYALPDRLYDDPDALAEWARKAFAAAAVKKSDQTAKPARKKASATRR